jgi:UDP-N-acetylmuramoyl-tripeptide--D-alanyl-D-alanine ligase
MKGRLVAGEGSRLFDGAALDSRRVRPGELFFALEGERTDGHRFVADAGRRGAAAAVIHRSVGRTGKAEVGELGLIRVVNTYDALHDLTRHVRRQVPEHLVAITGSVGKTTTKEFLAVLLARRFRVARNPGNLNNLFGFPLALLGIPDDTEWMVAEMGMSTPGELGQVSRLGRPDVAVFTNVRPVHLEFFASVRAIAEAKAELLEGLLEGGLLVINADEPELVRMAGQHRMRDPRARIVGYRVESADGSVAVADSEPGLRGEAGYRATGLEGISLRGAPRGVQGVGQRFRLVTPQGSVAVDLPLHGVHNVENFLAAAATAGELGVPLADLAAAAAELVPVSGRGEVHRLSGDVTVVDDSYNSNPIALTRALESAESLPGQRRWAVLGEMLELGVKGPELHRAAGREAARRGFDPVCGVGELARELVRAAAETGGWRGVRSGEGTGVTTSWFATAAEAADWAAKELCDGDLVLVKGSRGVGLEAVVRRLLETRRSVPSPRDAGAEGEV